MIESESAKDSARPRYYPMAVLKLMQTRLDTDPASFFNEFYAKVHRFVAAVTGAPQADVDDLVQETLLHAWSSRHQFRGESSALTWVLAIARNRVRLRRRDLGQEGRAEATLRALEAMETAPIPLDVLQSEESRRIVRQALEEIEEAYSDLLMQRYYHGRSVRAIAEASGESEKAVESRLHRAREALRDRIKRGVCDDRREA